MKNFRVVFQTITPWGLENFHGVSVKAANKITAESKAVRKINKILPLLKINLVELTDIVSVDVVPELEVTKWQ